MRDKRGSVFLYALVFVNFAAVLAYVVFSKSESIIEEIRYLEMESEFSENIEEKALAAFDSARYHNSDGNGFSDSLACVPLTMSGTASGSTYSETIPTRAALVGTEGACTGTSSVFAGETVRVSYGSGYLSFSDVSFRWSSTPVAGDPTLSGTLSDADATFVTFTPSGMSGIDFDLDSDDYRPYSSGTVLYPGGTADDDDAGRKTAYVPVRRDSKWHSVFWNSPEMMETIRLNPNNAGGLSAYPDEASGAYLRVSVDAPFSLRIVEFDRGVLANTKELKPLSSREASSDAAADGYVAANLSLTAWTGSAEAFDLATKTYGVFVKSDGNGSWYATAELSFVGSDGRSVYVTAIDDSKPDSYEFTGTDIITGSGYYAPRQLRITREK